MIFFERNDNQYLLVDPNLIDLRKKYSKVWQDESFPQKQWNRVKKQLQTIDDVPEFQAAIESIKATKLENPSVLEVGCSSGYLSEILKRSGIKAKYEGADYSPAFVRFARQKYPEIRFTVNDATDLHYEKESFDIIISGCCLLHIVDYEKAIAESARVAKKFVIFHRTPILHTTPTTFLTKTAYGAKMLEIFFNEEKLINLFHKYGLAVVMVKTISRGAVPGLSEEMTMKEYVCQKI